MRGGILFFIVCFFLFVQFSGFTVRAETLSLEERFEREKIMPGQGFSEDSLTSSPKSMWSL